VLNIHDFIIICPTFSACDFLSLRLLLPCLSRCRRNPEGRSFGGSKKEFTFAFNASKVQNDKQKRLQKQLFINKGKQTARNNKLQKILEQIAARLRTRARPARWVSKAVKEISGRHVLNDQYARDSHYAHFGI
jgi:hypothetical protein